MTGENIMSYIYVLELLRYGQMKIATSFFECSFDHLKKMHRMYNTRNDRKDCMINSDKIGDCFFKQIYGSLNLKQHIRIQSIP